MTVAEIQEYIDRLIKNEYQDDSEQRTPRNTRTHFEDIKSMLDELEEEENLGLWQVEDDFYGNRD